MDRYSLFLVSFIFMASPGFYLLAYTSGSISQVLALMIIILALLVSLWALISGKHSRLRFLVLILSVLPLVLSRGYLTLYIPTPIILKPANVTDYVVTIVASLLGFLLAGLTETFTQFRKVLEEKEYDEIDISSSLGAFGNTVFVVGLISFISGGLLYVIIRIFPSTNIGLFPAIVLFMAVYIVVFRSIFSKRKLRSKTSKK
ncbi:MAG: hypothetical protein AAE977_07020 [Thermoplasmataceae archaeon]|jgi:hypothetical protein